MSDALKSTRRFPGDRSSAESEWCTLYAYLKEHGYDLHARYHPDWVPSWHGLKKQGLIFYHEDGIMAQCYNILAATRHSDGLQVMLKMIWPSRDGSAGHGRYFSEEPRGSDGRNHCAPLLDVLLPPTFPDRQILVYKRYLPWNIWPFSRVSEITDLFAQAIEGLVFMHDSGVAHLDCSFSNLVMDGLHLLKEPNHPYSPRKYLHDPRRSARHMKRYQSDQPLRYYYIDFDQSVRFGFDNPHHLWQRSKGQDNTAPELQTGLPYDAFALDVYCLGHMMLTHWLNAYTNLEFIRPLVQDMMHPDSAMRPTARAVESRFRAIVAQLSATELRRSPKQVPYYDVTEYILGKVPARVPKTSTKTGLFVRFFRSRRHRVTCAPSPSSLSTESEKVTL